LSIKYNERSPNRDEFDGRPDAIALLDIIKYDLTGAIQDIEKCKGCNIKMQVATTLIELILRGNHFHASRILFLTLQPCQFGL